MPVQPGALLAGREVDVGLRPAARPLVLGPVEARRAQPVLPRELARVADAHPPLLGAVDEEEPAERPEGLTTERALGLLVDEDDPAARVGELGRGHEAGQSAADDDRVRVPVPHGAGRYPVWQGPPPHTSTIRPSGRRNCDFCSRAAGVRRGASCGSWPSRGGTLPAGGGGVARVSQNTTPEPASERLERPTPWNGFEGPLGVRPVAVALAVGGEQRPVHARADRPRLDLGGDVGHLVVAEADVQQHLVRAGVRQRVVGHVRRVAVRVGAVPQHLQQRMTSGRSSSLG